ncbi:MAG: hypothetical protein IPH89_10965 [Bacteroidetes bacterium]|nr:hypothetical protein [Bacteroidota bacterium]
MNKIFDFIFSKKTATRDEILNHGLKLALKWGKVWLTPIQSRLSRKFPFLSQSELDDYNQLCRQTMDIGFGFVRETLENSYDKKLEIKEEKLKYDFNKYMLEINPWINNSNLRQIFSQGLYYSWKDGLSEYLK